MPAFFIAKTHFIAHHGIFYQTPFLFFLLSDILITSHEIPESNERRKAYTDHPAERDR